VRSGIAVAGWLAVDLYHTLFEVDDLHFRDAVVSVERQLDGSPGTQAAVADLDQEEDVAGGRGGAAVGIDASAEEDGVWLRLAVGAEADGVAYCDDRAVANGTNQKPGQVVGGPGIVTAVADTPTSSPPISST
jgi:hypothetical protein